jgi:broad specificity phosphatase PhoE
MGARVVEALRDIAASHPVARVLVVTHGGPLCAVWLAAGRELSAWQRCENGHGVEITVEGGQIHWIDEASEQAGQRVPSAFSQTSGTPERR